MEVDHRATQLDNADSRSEGYVRELSDRQAIAKAHFIGRDTSPSNVKQPEDGLRDQRVFEQAQSLAPPYDPLVLCKLFEHSNSLRQNVDAYAVNIDGNGHRFEPVIDLDADDAEDVVRDSMFLQSISEAEAANQDPPTTPPNDAEVKAKVKEIEREMRLEKSKLENFFRFCCVDESFISLRQKTRSDKEIMGNGYWEVLRNAEGEPVQFNYIPGFTVRMLRLDSNPIQVTQRIKRTHLAFDEIVVHRRFRRFIQVFEGRKIYFKEFGDPRTISATTGRVYKDFKALEREEGADGQEAIAATEMVHFKIHSPRTSYGVPRWIGNLLAVLGSRQSEEVNFLYFENKGVPPMAVLVSGGSLTQESVTRIEDFINEKIKGRQNFHKIMVIEAEGSGTGALDSDASSRMKIEIVPLTSSQQSDALFQNYDERNIDKVGMSFRLPRLLRGDIRDFNRATADAALEFSETQVFSPERHDFDWLINRKILPELGIRYWTFASNAPNTHNPIDLSDILANLVNASILTPEDARELAKDIFNRDFKRVDAFWAKVPPDILKAMFKAGIDPEDPEVDDDEEGEEGEDNDEGTEEGAEGDRPPAEVRKALRRYRRRAEQRGLHKVAAELVKLRSILRDAESESILKNADAKAAEEMEREVIQLPDDEFRALVGK